MQTILHEKKMMVIRTLLDRLSNKNQDDFEETLNASGILKEFCEEEQSYEIMVEHDNLCRLIEIVC
eukprot:CAMPEP_0176363748 /NCGR_PEP_ID=MMETSP0126-20121128/19319_1 /TAXON_ID=141414 ORGANISM="Strombidinopsis acuminatum, Strain SPMC142" /NCGR_SAMPLE_ID=MMETSP0126 /ASSEMBLY_ACC=CAM_ASM_000229 /LENGTH=65 /DNA_ID=CAMNT_0017720137 /DNA_START=1131 /DNA_END=1328 /DNA_ORIENTATION=+